MELSALSKELIILAVSLLLGILGMKPIDWLKRQFGLDDQYALLFVYVIAAAVGVLGMLASGQIFAIEFTLENVVAIAGAFIGAAKFAYEQMKASA